MHRALYCLQSTFMISSAFRGWLSTVSWAGIMLPGSNVYERCRAQPQPLHRTRNLVQTDQLGLVTLTWMQELGMQRICPLMADSHSHSPRLTLDISSQPVSNLCSLGFR